MLKTFTQNIKPFVCVFTSMKIYRFFINCWLGLACTLKTKHESKFINCNKFSVGKIKTWSKTSLRAGL